MPETSGPPPDWERRRSTRITSHRPNEGGPPPFIWSLRVRSYELDASGRVSDAVYMNYLEGARVEAMASAGLTLDRQKREKIHVVVAAAALRYLSPSHGHDELDVSIEVTRIGRTSITMHQTIQNKTTSRLTVDAEIVGVFIGPDGRPMPVPEDLVRAFGPPPDAA